MTDEPKVLTAEEIDDFAHMVSGDGQLFAIEQRLLATIRALQSQLASERAQGVAEGHAHRVDVQAYTTGEVSWSEVKVNGERVLTVTAGMPTDGKHERMANVVADRLREALTKGPLIPASTPPAAPARLDVDRTAQPKVDGLTHEEIIIACGNIGHDMKCGACAEMFYTGQRHHEHDPGCATPQSDVDALRAEVVRLGDDLRIARNVADAYKEAADALVASRDEFHALRAKVERKEAALRRCIDVLALCTSRDWPAPEDGEVMSLGSRIGFGALMSAASKTWRDWAAAHGVPAGSQFTCGPCEVTVEETLKEARAALDPKPEDGPKR